MWGHPTQHPQKVIKMGIRNDGVRRNKNSWKGEKMTFSFTYLFLPLCFENQVIDKRAERKGNEIKSYLREQSPTFLALGTSFVEDSFSTDGVGRVGRVGFVQVVM